MTKLNAAFWKWFGDSKVVDANGEPLIVYHGTGADFSEFKVPKRDDGHDTEVYYFSHKPEYASIYAEGGYGETAKQGHVKAVYLSLQNPFDTRKSDHMALVKKSLKQDGSKPWEIKA